MTWLYAQPPVARRGYVLGSRFPTLDVIVEISSPIGDMRDLLFEALDLLLPDLAGDASIAKWRANTPAEQDPLAQLRVLLSFWQAVQLACGLPVHETGQIVTVRPPRARCLVPVLADTHRSVAHMVGTSLQWLAQRSAAPDPGAHGPAAEAFIAAVRALAAEAVPGANNAQFLKAAYELRLPVQRLAGGIIQYGVGRRQRRLDSSFTDATPTMAARLARNKAWANSLMAQAGFPVPLQRSVRNAAEAVQAANQIGYPVVVKPADRDGGVGVAARLTNEAQVRDAYDAAVRHSRKILVEKHAEGRDYRLTVFNGTLIAAVERVPASVTGDGISTIAELVAVVNTDPLRGEGTRAPLKRLVLDDEAVQILKGQGLEPSSIVEAGRFVHLRYIANIATGGKPVAMMEKVHPDNARLAVRAAEQFGLDIAGIDLLIPDVSRSWTEVGNTPAICEINGQPHLGRITTAHVYGQILEHLVSAGGRVPTIVVLGAVEPDAWVDALERALTSKGYRVGVAGSTSVRVAGEIVSVGPSVFMKAGTMLLRDRTVDAIVAAVTESSLLQTGLPFDRYDALVMPDDHVSPAEWPDRAATRDPFALIARHLLPACDGQVFVGAAADRLTAYFASTTASWQACNGEVFEATSDIVETVLDLEKRRSDPQLSQSP